MHQRQKGTGAGMISKTALHEAHLALGAKMGEFAGYDMPLYYSEGVMKEHEWVRTSAGIFDVSHMGQIIMQGQDIAKFIETITPSSFQNKALGRAQYTVLTNEKGGIVDDIIVTRLEQDKFFIVLNAGCKEKDMAWIKQHMPKTITLDYLSQRSLIALQGPKAEQVLKEVFGVDTSSLGYMQIMQDLSILGVQVHISRLGYTGEDGFELSVPSAKAVEFWKALLDNDKVKPIGLAARDSLRLEMGYCLYGHDIDDQTSPTEANLSWIMGKDVSGFIGSERILKERQLGPSRLRVGVRLIDKGVAREGAEICDLQGNKIGILTSGGPSPTLKLSIGQGYVPVEYAKEGTQILVTVRGKNLAAQIAAMPFVQARTKSAKKKAAA